MKQENVGYVANHPGKDDDNARDHRENLPQSLGPSSTFSRQLGVALNRALERRFGKVPSPTVVSMAAEALGGTKGLDFVRHAVRVQEQLASLHAQLQKDQERHRRASEALEDSSVSSMVPQKRSVGHDDKPADSPRETKRIRVESTDSHRHTPPSASDNGVKPELQTPVAPMSPNHVPIAPRIDSLPPRLPTTNTTPSNDAKSESSRQTGPQSPLDATLSDGNHGQTISRPSTGTVTHDQNKLEKAPSPPLPTLIPEAEAAPLTTAVTPSSTLVFPAFTRQQIPSSAPPNSSGSQDPEIWAIQVGKPSTSQTDVEFVVNQETADSVRRWATHKRQFDPNSRHIAVHLVALQTTAVSAAQQSLSQSSQGITPQAFAQALRNLPPQWPDDDSLVLQVNAGQPGEKSWFASDMSGGAPLDISSAVCEGTNSLRIMQLRNMADIVFAMYAARPTPEVLAAAREWEKGRKWTSFQRPHSGRLPM